MVSCPTCAKKFEWYLLLVVLFWLSQPWEAGVGGPALPSQILADQLNLSQPWGEAHYAHYIATCPPDCQTVLRPCSSELKFAHQPSQQGVYCKVCSVVRLVQINFICSTFALKETIKIKTVKNSTTFKIPIKVS